MNLTRRKLFGGLGLVIAAPAIVRAASLMPVRGWREPITWGRSLAMTALPDMRDLEDMRHLEDMCKMTSETWFYGNSFAHATR